MSANDPGHVNNLQSDQVSILKRFWLTLIDYMRGSESKIDSIYVAELFLAIGSDNPDVILLRWLRARKWDVNGALLQLMETIRWRHEWGVKELLAKGETDLCHEEILTGKNYFLGFDKMGRPISYVSVKDHIKGQFSSESTEKLTVFTMETGRKLLQSGNESVTVIFDMTDFSLKNMDYQHLKFLINLLQNYYPESFALGLILNAPWVFNGCWYIIRPWLDPVVESKIHFLNNLDDLTQFIDPAVLPKQLNGTHTDFNYIPPTEEDLAMIATLRNDKEGKLKVEEEHRQAIQNYLSITDRWAQTDQIDDVREERTKATLELRDAYERLVPYINTRTHYHRIGMIDEAAFDIAYQRIQRHLDD